MGPWIHSDVQDLGTNDIKVNANVLHLIKQYALGDAYATVTGNSIANTAMAATDYTLAGAAGAARTLTSATGKTATAGGSSAVSTTGTATAGSATTLTAATAWTVNAYVGFAVLITAGTGSGQAHRVIASNTATVLTVDTAWATTPDATSVFAIQNNLRFAFVDSVNSKVLWVTDETTDQIVTAGNTVTFPSLVYTSNQPT